MSSSDCDYGVRSCTRVGALALTLAAAAMLAQPAIGQSGASTGSGPEVAVQWQAHDFQFHYFGFTTYYTCEGFEDRLEHILRELGANSDVRVSVINCSGTNDISKTTWARVRVRMPVAPTDTAADSFVASSKVVSLRVHDSSMSGSGDCELLESVRDQILPVLKMELVKDDLNCVPGQATHISRSLQVKALIPAKVK